jgi:hypothetical protein
MQGVVRRYGSRDSEDWTDSRDVKETESTGLEAAMKIQEMMMILTILLSEGLHVPGAKLFIVL